MELAFSGQISVNEFFLGPVDLKEYRLALFQQIHEIVFYGKGGYDYETVYYMPNWLRKFTYHEINEHYKAESEALEQAKNGKSSVPKPAAKGPQVRTPNFTVKPRK